jgi:uncharacterized membrane protein
MAVTMRIDPRGHYGLHQVISRAKSLRACIKVTATDVRIDLADGRSARFGREHPAAVESVVAAAMQWARRHGASSIDIEMV